MNEELQFPRAAGFDRDYWLGHCEGFRVFSGDRRLGVVEEARFASRHDRPDWLVVRGGLLGNRTVVVPVDDVLRIVPREERIEVRVARQADGELDLLGTLRRLARSRVLRA